MTVTQDQMAGDENSLWNEISLASWVLKDYQDATGFCKWRVTYQDDADNEEGLLFRRHREMACVDRLGDEVSKNMISSMLKACSPIACESRAMFPTPCSVWLQEKRTYTSRMNFVPRLIRMAAIWEEVIQPGPSPLTTRWGQSIHSMTVFSLGSSPTFSHSSGGHYSWESYSGVLCYAPVSLHGKV